MSAARRPSSVVRRPLPVARRPTSCPVRRPKRGGQNLTFRPFQASSDRRGAPRRGNDRQQRAPASQPPDASRSQLSLTLLHSPQNGRTFVLEFDANGCPRFPSRALGGSSTGSRRLERKPKKN